MHTTYSRSEVGEGFGGGKTKKGKKKHVDVVNALSSDEEHGVDVDDDEEQGVMGGLEEEEE